MMASETFSDPCNRYSVLRSKGQIYHLKEEFRGLFLRVMWTRNFEIFKKLGIAMHFVNPKPAVVQVMHISHASFSLEEIIPQL